MFGIRKNTAETPPKAPLSVERAIRNSALRIRVKDDRTMPDIKKVLGALEGCFYIIDQVQEKLTHAAQVTLIASNTDENAHRALLAEQYDEHRMAISQIIANAERPAKFLLSTKMKPLSARLSTQSVYSIAPVNLDVDETGLHLPPPLQAFDNYQEIGNILDHLDNAFERLDEISDDFMQDVRFLVARLDRTFNS